MLISSAIYAVGGSTGRDITYYYIMVTLFISAFSRRFYTFLWVAAVVVIIAVFQLFNPALEWSDTIRGPLAFNVFGAAIILTVTSFWNTREREKRTQLEISERKRTELLVQQEQQRVLSKFVAAVTHDFRNRLSTVEVNQHLLRRKLERGDKLDTVAEHIDKTHTAVQQMTYQMENMGLVIGLENTTQTKVDLQLTVDGIARRMQRVAQERHVTLTIVPQAERVYANCNHAHIEVALQQLIQNAVAYTPPGGGVTVTFAHTDETITVTVRDDGIGIAAEHLPHIFEPFYKIDDARTTSQAGLGLGLTLVKLIAEAYHGAITVESEPGVGSTFRFSLPTQPPLL
ncbi:MAG: HAMP domain-containing histidine kinase [Chloroflexi bacterium]|uniref:sensor histidine kinase n=1 Tax=Candidatus Flexifilum breve TaxID=3140694 RepID=UPI0031360964|nr:HAMP domain-containing histidine kinase [Chloroflexota bacterium]